MKAPFVHTVGWLYRNIAAPVFFLFDSEPIHHFFLNFGYLLAKTPGATALMSRATRVRHPSLETSVAGIQFENPIGLAAGFDYNGQLPPVMGAIGFGFCSVGTVTNGAYEGNPYPRMKRLVNSQSLLINKGFKSAGVKAITERLSRLHFTIPTGISIGATNRGDYTSHEDVIEDILDAFRTVIESRIPVSYFEINISCPNLKTSFDFYEPTRLRQLLTAICGLGLPRPLIIKMPIHRTNAETLELVDVVRQFPIAAMIFGNLQHDRSEISDKSEMASIEKHRGHMSGKPCQNRSDEVIELVYTHTKGQAVIIGCGGVFNAEDAYRKIRLGASLVMLATGLVFMGPQLPAEINADLPGLLRKDGFHSIREAIGADSK